MSADGASIRADKAHATRINTRAFNLKYFPRQGPAGEAMLAIFARHLPPRHCLFRRFETGKTHVARPARWRNSKFNSRHFGGFPQKPAVRETSAPFHAGFFGGTSFCFPPKRQIK